MSEFTSTGLELFICNVFSLHFNCIATIKLEILLVFIFSLNTYCYVYILRIQYQKQGINNSIVCPTGEGKNSKAHPEHCLRTVFSLWIAFDGVCMFYLAWQCKLCEKHYPALEVILLVWDGVKGEADLFWEWCAENSLLRFVATASKTYVGMAWFNLCTKREQCQSVYDLFYIYSMMDSWLKCNYA